LSPVIAQPQQSVNLLRSKAGSIQEFAFNPDAALFVLR
jgi:hypothetical protein